MTDTEFNPGPKNLRRGFRARIDHDPEPPATLTRAQAKRLSPEDLASYDDARLTWFASDVLIDTPTSSALIKQVKRLVRTRRPVAVGERTIALSGASHVGKTTALFQLAREIEADARRDDPDFIARGHSPVVYLEIPAGCTPKGVLAMVLNFFDVPHSYRAATQQDLMKWAVEQFRVHHTKVVIVDEMQMLRLRGTTGDDTINTLKNLLNQAGVTVVYAGVNLREGLASLAAQQLLKRAKFIHATPYENVTDLGRATWLNLVNYLGSEMLLIGADENHLGAHANDLYRRTGGSIGNMRMLLADVMELAIEQRGADMHEHVTVDILAEAAEGFEGWAAA